MKWQARGGGSSESKAVAGLPRASRPPEPGGVVNRAVTRSARLTNWLYGTTRGIARRLRDYWMTRSLAQQFAVVSAAVLIAGMLAIGSWVTERIKQGIMHNSAASGALLMDSYIAPLVQDLATVDSIRPENQRAIDQLLQFPAIASRVTAIKIWRPDGTIAYSNWHEKIGQKFRPTPNFLRALEGAISAEFEGEHHEDDSHERALEAPLLEIYAPVRARNTDRIIAVSEFYEMGGAIKSELVRAEALTWLFVAVITAWMVAALSGIVSRGSRTIEEQRSELEAQVDELQMLLARNRELSRRVERASRRTAVINEKLLRRVGADLHDGPAQLLSLALLRLDALKPLWGEGGTAGVAADLDGRTPGVLLDTPDTRAEAQQNLEKIRRSLNDAMKEIREISSGLALPELGRAGLDEVVQMAIRAHERKTETRVAARIEVIARPVPDEFKTCVYRFVQEGLNNAFRHAAGHGQSVALRLLDTDLIEIAVEDDGPGLPSGASATGGGGLGLSGLRDRIESLDGTMDVVSAAGRGTRIVARFDLGKLKTGDARDD